MKHILCIFVLWIGWSSYQLIRGKSVAPSISFLTDITKKTDDMGKKVTLQEFVRRSSSKHNGKYSYELVTNENYSTLLSVVPIICPIHGRFEQLAENHVRGHGCEHCAKENPRYKKRKKIHGVGILDVDYSYTIDAKTELAYNIWHRMLSRCYSTTKPRSYAGCCVCEEWRFFSNFKRWFDNPLNGYKEGYHLDKDILVYGNKVYSPDTCCFVPQEINKLFIKMRSNGKFLPSGVSKVTRGNSIRYHSYFSCNCKRVNLGYFTNAEEAFLRYKNAREKYVKEKAKECFDNGKITQKVFDAITNYKEYGV